MGEFQLNKDWKSILKAKLASDKVDVDDKAIEDLSLNVSSIEIKSPTLLDLTKLLTKLPTGILAKAKIEVSEENTLDILLSGMESGLEIENSSLD